MKIAVKVVPTLYILIFLVSSVCGLSNVGSILSQFTKILSENSFRQVTEATEQHLLLAVNMTCTGYEEDTAPISRSIQVSVYSYAQEGELPDCVLASTRSKVMLVSNRTTEDSVTQEGQTVDLPMNSTSPSKAFYGINFDIEDTSVARVSPKKANIRCNTVCQLRVIVTGIFVGETHLKVRFHDGTSTTPTGERNDGGDVGIDWGSPLTVPVYVIRAIDDLAEAIFLYSVIALVGIVTLGFGAKLDLKLVWTLLRKPIAPVIGVACQFTVMPLLAFGVAKGFSLPNSLALGLFAAGCAPGGGTSNIWSLLLGGNVDLSITMTLISTIASIALVPMWMYTLGETFLEDTDIAIPFEQLVLSVFGVAVPIVAGIALKRILPKVAKIIVRAQKPLSALCVLVLGFLGFWTKRYIFYIIAKDWRIIVCSGIVPYGGLTIATAIGFALRQEPRNRLTIALETAVQNTSIPIIILQQTLPQPQSDLAIVIPVAMNFFLPVPFGIAACVRGVYLRWQKGRRGCKELLFPEAWYQKKLANNSNTFEVSFKAGITSHGNTLMSERAMVNKEITKGVRGQRSTETMRTSENLRGQQARTADSDESDDPRRDVVSVIIPSYLEDNSNERSNSSSNASDFPTTPIIVTEHHSNSNQLSTYEQPEDRDLHATAAVGVSTAVHPVDFSGNNFANYDKLSSSALNGGDGFTSRQNPASDWFAGPTANGMDELPAPPPGSASEFSLDSDLLYSALDRTEEITSRQFLSPNVFLSSAGSSPQGNRVQQMAGSEYCSLPAMNRALDRRRSEDSQYSRLDAGNDYERPF